MDVIVGDEDGLIRYFEKSGYSCSPCPPGFYVPLPPALPACTPCDKGHFNSQWNQSTCALGKEGFQVFSSDKDPAVCDPGTIGHYEGGEAERSEQHIVYQKHSLLATLLAL